LNKASGIGTERNVLTIDVNQLDVTNVYDGGIYITDQDDLILKDLNDDATAIDTMVTKKIVATGKLDIVDDIRTNQNFVLASSDQINIESNIINSGKEKLTLTATNDIIQIIDAIVLGAGDILIDETDNVILKALTTFEGSIAVNSGGCLEAIEVRSLNIDNVRNVLMTSGYK